MPVIRRFEGNECPNRCGNGVSRRDGSEPFHCYRCGVDAVVVEYVVMRADDHRGAVDRADALVTAWDAWMADMRGDSDDEAAFHVLKNAIDQLRDQ